MAFKFCHDDATRELYILQPCLTDSIYVIFQVFLSNFHEYLPMRVINVYFCWQCSQSSLLFSFCRLLSIGCATALPMGVAPEAIAEIFGYRLKRIDKPASYTSSCIICRLYSPLQWISPLCMLQAPRVKDEVNLRVLTDIVLFPVPFSLFVFYIYTRHFS
jgi:hypothetical protein